jgi:hypothetical protein
MTLKVLKNSGQKILMYIIMGSIRVQKLNPKVIVL